MFDLKMQADDSAVPVPLAGRVLVFVDDFGTLRGRLSDGSFVELGGSGGGGIDGYATDVLALKPSFANTAERKTVFTVQSFQAGPNFPYSIDMTASGYQTNGTAASSLVLALWVDGAELKTITVALGTVAKTNRPWTARIFIEADAVIVARLELLVDGVAAPVPALAFTGNPGSGTKTLEMKVGFAAAVATASAMVSSGSVRRLGAGVRP